MPPVSVYSTFGRADAFVIIVVLIFPLFHVCFFLCFIKDDLSESEGEQNSGDEDLNEVERKQLQGVTGTVRHPEVNGITTEVCMFVCVTTASNHSLDGGKLPEPLISSIESLAMDL